MASSYFSFSPTAVTSNPGNKTVTAQTTTTNTGQTDKSATITLSNTLGNSKTVQLVQRYRPWFLQTSHRTFPAIGGNLYFTAHTEYDIKFEAIPSWITLKLGNQTITTSTTISAADADGQMFTMIASQNTAQTSRSATNTFCMRHYIGSTLQSYKDYLEVYQDGVVENYIVITSSTIPCTGGTIRGYVEENEDFIWTAGDHIRGWDTSGGYHELNSEDVMNPYTGPGSATTNFTVTIPQNPTLSAITWWVPVVLGYPGTTKSASTVQEACEPAPPTPPTPTPSDTAFTLSSNYIAATGGSLTATVYTGEYLAYGFGDNIVGNYVDDGTSYATILMEDVLTPWEDPAPTGNLYYHTPWTITLPANNTGRDIEWWFRISPVDESGSRRCYFIQLAS